MGCGTSRNKSSQASVRPNPSTTATVKAETVKTEKVTNLRKSSSKLTDGNKKTPTKDLNVSKTTVVTAARLLSADAVQTVGSMFGSREKQSAYSKKTPAKDLEFIEQPGEIHVEEKELGSRTGSRETQKTMVSIGSTGTGRLPPISSDQPRSTRSRTAVSLPNVVGTPIDGSRMSSVRWSRQSRERRSWSLSSEEEIINHWRPPSASSLPNSPLLPPPPLSSSPTLFRSASRSQKSRPERRSFSSDTSSFVFVQRKVRVAWEGPRKKEEGEESGTEPTTSSETSASSSTYDRSSSNTVSQSGAETDTPNGSETDSDQKITVLPEEKGGESVHDRVSINTAHDLNGGGSFQNKEAELFSNPSSPKNDAITNSDRIVVSKAPKKETNANAKDAESPQLPENETLKKSSDGRSFEIVRKSRSGSALARLKQIRQLSLPSFSFVRKSFSPRSSPDTILPNGIHPTHSSSSKEKTDQDKSITSPFSSQNPLSLQKHKNRFFRSRTIDFSSIRNRTTSANKSREKRSKDASSVLPNRRKRVGPSASMLFSKIESNKSADLPSAGNFHAKSNKKDSVASSKRRIGENLVGSTVQQGKPKKELNQSKVSQPQVESLSESEDHFEFGDEEIDVESTCPTVFHEFFNDFPMLFDDVLEDADFEHPSPVSYNAAHDKSSQLSSEIINLHLPAIKKLAKSSAA